MKFSRAFTLIELMVSMALFAVVMTIAAGAYLVVIGADRDAQAVTKGINNLSFALEVMTRSMRTGTLYDCGAGAGDCSGGEPSFSFTDSDGNLVEYLLSSSSIEELDASVGVPEALTDSSVTITSLTFYVSGALSSDTTQPYVTILVSGTVSSGPGKAVPFHVETSAAMRGPNLPGSGIGLSTSYSIASV
jgi:prepilin-type N-terminal cleavage/methylation domain-containing protein